VRPRQYHFANQENIKLIQQVILQYAVRKNGLAVLFNVSCHGKKAIKERRVSSTAKKALLQDADGKKCDSFNIYQQLCKRLL